MPDRPARGATSLKRTFKAFDPKDFLAKVGGGRSIAHYTKNHKIYAQGDDADAVFYIQKGEVKVTVVSEQGREAVIAILVKDGFFGEGCLAGQKKRMSTAMAHTDCEIMRIERLALVAVLRDQPAFADLFVAHLLTRTIRVEEDLVDQLFNSSEKRLARTLLLLANFGKEGKPETIITKVSQETLAEMIGTTRSRVSFFMNKFRKLGLHQLQRQAGSALLAPQRGADRPSPDQEESAVADEVGLARSRS
ncbi:MAG: Crp/Fnr family transcriptional regulator [Rhizomicrobium sp.]